MRRTIRATPLATERRGTTGEGVGAGETARMTPRGAAASTRVAHGAGGSRRVERVSSPTGYHRTIRAEGLTSRRSRPTSSGPPSTGSPTYGGTSFDRAAASSRPANTEGGNDLRRGQAGDRGGEPEGEGAAGRPPGAGRPGSRRHLGHLHDIHGAVLGGQSSRRPLRGPTEHRRGRSRGRRQGGAQRGTRSAGSARTGGEDESGGQGLEGWRLQPGGEGVDLPVRRAGPSGSGRFRGFRGFRAGSVVLVVGPGPARWPVARPVPRSPG